MGFLLRALYILWGFIILFPVCFYSIGKKNLPKLFYYYDNEEDGFTGNKRVMFGPNHDKGWFDDYLGIESSKLSRFKQAYYAYKWSAMRNPAWNLRFHPLICIIINNKTVFDIEGNTVKHDWKPGKQWYNCVIDKKYKSYFRLIPLTKTKSLYLRWGWKVYPEFAGNIPDNKGRSIQAISIRIRGA